MSPRLAPGYTGHLRKIDGKIVGELLDSWGWRIFLKAEPAPGGGYVITGVLGETPPDFWVEAIDGERPAE